MNVITVKSSSLAQNVNVAACTLARAWQLSIARRAGCLVLGVALLLPPLAAAQTYKETYPRLAAIEIASANKVTNPDYRQALSKHDILIFGMWHGWAKRDTVSGDVLSIRDVVVDIKKRAKASGNGGILIGKYTTFNESGSNPDNPKTNVKWQKLHNETGPGYPVNNDWYARTSSGENTSSYPGNWLTNVTDFVRRDSNGDTYPEWAVGIDYGRFFRDIPEFDIWYFDNWFYRPRVTADWDGDGKNDDKNAESTRKPFREGYARGLRRAKKLAPNLIMMGNVDAEASQNWGMLTEAEYRGTLTALYEGAIGKSWSTETWSTWERMMKQYQTTIFNAQDNVAAMTVHGPKDDYALMRYGLASCLMDNGYYYYTSHKEEYGSTYWYDEYDVDLGRAIDPPQFKAWQSGVYRRRFEKGIVLVNPKGNGTRTVAIEAGYKRIDGSQDGSQRISKLITCAPQFNSVLQAAIRDSRSFG